MVTQKKISECEWSFVDEDGLNHSENRMPSYVYSTGSGLVFTYQHHGAWHCEFGPNRGGTMGKQFRLDFKELKGRLLLW